MNFLLPALHDPVYSNLFSTGNKVEYNIIAAEEAVDNVQTGIILPKWKLFYLFYDLPFFSITHHYIKL